VDLHHLLLAGLPAHFESYMPSHAVRSLWRFWKPTPAGSDAVGPPGKSVSCAKTGEPDSRKFCS
jgi:hypothetical protein